MAAHARGIKNDGVRGRIQTGQDGFGFALNKMRVGHVLAVVHRVANRRTGFFDADHLAHQRREQQGERADA